MAIPRAVPLKSLPDNFNALTSPCENAAEIEHSRTEQKTIIDFFIILLYMIVLIWIYKK
jgi:hypothetical protein